MLLLLLEELRNLAFGCAMDAQIGHRALPFDQPLIFGRQAIEGAPGQSVALNISYAVFNLAFMLRGSWQARQDHRPVVASELQQFWVELRIGKIKFEHRRFKIIQINCLGNSAEIAEGIFQAANERLGVLMEDRLAISLAGETQNDAEHPGLAAGPLAGKNRSTRTKIHLRLFAWTDLDAPDPRRVGFTKLAHQPLNRLIGAGELHLDFKILIDPLR